MVNQMHSAIFLFLLTVLNTSIDASVPVETPIYIQSDNAAFEQTKLLATYEGNVVMQQGSHILHAQTLAIKKNANGALTRITASGNPATFTGNHRHSTHPVYAKANIIYYYPNKELLILEGNAELQHQQDKFQGPSLHYQLDTQVISASKHNNQRPTVTILPRSS